MLEILTHNALKFGKEIKMIMVVETLLHPLSHKYNFSVNSFRKLKSPMHAYLNIITLQVLFVRDQSPYVTITASITNILSIVKDY